MEEQAIVVTEATVASMESYNKQIELASQLQAEALATVEGKKGDTRAMLGFAPFNIDTTKSLDDPQVQAEFRAYVLDYGSGDPDRRRPHLDKMFDAVEQMNLDFDYTDAQTLLDKGADIVRLGQLATYCENLRKDNPEYYQKRYGGDPQREDLLQSHATIGSAIAGFGMQVFLREGFMLDDGSSVPPMSKEDNEDLYQQFMVGVTVGQQKLQAAEDIRSGKPPQPLRIADFKYDQKYSAVSMATVFGGKKMPTQEDCVNASTLFVSVEHYFNDTPAIKNMRKDAGLSNLDMIFIDGKSATELYGDKYRNIDVNQRENAIKGEVLAALGSGRQRVEVANIVMDGKGEPTVALQTMSMDVSSTQPTKKEEYSRGRRLFDFGPFKCKSRQERIDQLEAKDNGREARQQAIAEKLQPTVTQCYAKSEAQHLADMQKAMLAEVAMSKAKVREALMRNPQDEQYFAHVSADMDERNQRFKIYTGEGLAQVQSRVISRGSMAELCMLKAGYTTEQIICDDGPEIKAARAKAGRAWTDMLDRKDIKEISEFYLESGDKLRQQRLPDIDWGDPAAVASSNVFLTRVAAMNKDLDQAISETTQKYIIDEMGVERWDTFIAGVGVLNHINSAMTRVVRLVDSKDNPLGKENPLAELVGRAAGSLAALSECGSILGGKTINEVAAAIDDESFAAKVEFYTVSACMMAASDDKGYKECLTSVIARKPLQFSKTENGYSINGKEIEELGPVRKVATAAPRIKMDRKEMEAAERAQKQRVAAKPNMKAPNTMEKKVDGPDRH